MTGWAALRWLGARWFDGSRRAALIRDPVDACGRCHGAVRSQPGSPSPRSSCRRATASMVDGLQVTVPVCALLRDALRPGRRAPRLARSRWRLLPTWCRSRSCGDYPERLLRTGPAFPRAASGAEPGRGERVVARARSTWRLVWQLDAGLPRPLLQPSGLRPRRAAPRDAGPDRRRCRRGGGVRRCGSTSPASGGRSDLAARGQVPRRTGSSTFTIVADDLADTARVGRAGCTRPRHGRSRSAATERSAGPSTRRRGGCRPTPWRVAAA